MLFAQTNTVTVTLNINGCLMPSDYARLKSGTSGMLTLTIWRNNPYLTRHRDSRINFIYTLLSKRKLHWFVDQNLVTGWDDPRFPTVRGIRRRGLTLDALRTYMLAQGPSQAQMLLEWDGIWAANKKVIDPIVPRFWAIVKEKRYALARSLVLIGSCKCQRPCHCTWKRHTFRRGREGAPKAQEEPRGWHKKDCIFVRHICRTRGRFVI